VTGAQRADVPIICVTEQSDVALAVRTIKAGAIDVLTKPVCVETLLAAVRHAFELSAAAVQRAVQQQVEACLVSLSRSERHGRRSATSPERPASSGVVA